MAIFSQVEWYISIRSFTLLSGVLGNKHLKFDIWGKEMETFQSTLEHVMELNKGGIFLTEEARTTERQNSN